MIVSWKDKFKTGSLVKVKTNVKAWGGKTGTIIGTGVQLGYPVVRVKFPSAEITFSPEELEPI